MMIIDANDKFTPWKEVRPRIGNKYSDIFPNEKKDWGQQLRNFHLLFISPTFDKPKSVSLMCPMDVIKRLQHKEKNGKKIQLFGGRTLKDR